MELLEFGRDTPCPACGITLEIRSVCHEAHGDLEVRAVTHGAPASGPEVGGNGVDHLHVVCPGCRWTGYMRVAMETLLHGDAEGPACGQHPEPNAGPTAGGAMPSVPTGDPG